MRSVRDCHVDAWEVVNLIPDLPYMEDIKMSYSFLLAWRFEET